MHRYLILITFLFSLSSICSAQANYHFIIHEALQDSSAIPAKDQEVYDAIAVWENYVMTQNDSLLIARDRNDSSLTSRIESQIFSKSFPRDAIYFHVLGYRTTSNYFILENLIRYEYPRWNVNSIMSYFSIGVIKEGDAYKLFFLFDKYLADLVKTRSKWITYYSPPSDIPPKSVIKNANKFCDSVATVFNLNVDKPFNYIISQGTRGFEAYGHYFFWGTTSQKFEARGESYLLDNKTPGNYRHELVHLLFRDYPVINIVQEGIATWLGGSSYYKTYADAIDTLKTLPFSDKKELEKIVAGMPPYWQGIFRYAVGGVVVEQAYKQGGVPLLKKILRDDKSKDIYEIIQKHLDIGQMEPMDFLIKLIQEK